MQRRHPAARRPMPDTMRALVKREATEGIWMEDVPVPAPALLSLCVPFILDLVILSLVHSFVLPFFPPFFSLLFPFFI